MPAFTLAAVRPHDIAATRSYLRIIADQQRVEISDVGKGVTAIRTLERRIAAECPGALAYAPRDTAYEELGEEVEDVLSIAFDDAVISRTQALGHARAVDALSWSNRRLTRLVRDRAAEERAYATDPPPNLCAQIAAWRESAYIGLPAGSRRFLAEMRASEFEVSVGLEEEAREAVIARMLKPYEGPAERRLARKILGLENRIAVHLDTTTNSAERELAAVLGVAEL